MLGKTGLHALLHATASRKLQKKLDSNRYTAEEPKKSRVLIPTAKDVTWYWYGIYSKDLGGLRKYQVHTGRVKKLADVLPNP